MNSDQVLIPRARIAVLIGEKGKDKRFIEKLGRVKLQINSKEGSVTIKGEPINIWLASKVVDAIGRGFSPKDASILFKEGYSLEKVDIRDFKAKSKERQRTIKARVIGTDGKIKKLIQKNTNTKLAIQGKTVSIMGKAEDVMLARQAVERILQGAKQGSALSILNK